MGNRRELGKYVITLVNTDTHKPVSVEGYGCGRTHSQALKDWAEEYRDPSMKVQGHGSNAYIQKNETQILVARKY